ncbi:MAG: Ig-like domain-containing protein, partial [Rhodobacter sp.]|nr:Ig-like domain-containing protein [Rhodobacter sp.]
MSNFDPNSVNNLVGLWDFIAGNETADTGLDDGVAQNGAFFGNGSASGDRAHFDGHGDRFDVSGNDDPFDMSKGTIEVQYRQDSHIGTSPDTLVSRGEYADRGSEGYFSISVQLDGSVQVIHCDGGGEEAVVTTDAGLVSPGDHVNVKYSWDEDTGVQLIVENGTSGESQTVVDDTTGLTMEIGDNDDENFTFAAREEDDGDYDRFFDGSIDYVAIYESEATGPDGAVDGEAFGEVMELGYDDSNAPTDQGGDMITNDADLIFGNGGDDTIDGAAGDDTIFGDDGGSAPPVREIFQWSEAPGFASDDDDDDDEADDFTQNTGSANITFTILSEQGNATTDYEGTTQNTDLLDANVDENASMESTTNGDNGSAAYSWTSDVPISNVEFRVNDIDGDGRIRIEAYDADGNLVQVMLSDAGSGLALSDTDGVPGNDTATSTDNNYTDDAADEHSVLVNIAGPIVEFRLYHEQDGNFNTAVNVTDITFDVIAFDPGEAGDDVITGAEGSDQMFGQDGDDTFIVDNASDGDGDVIVGGNGPDDTADNDVLDLRGAGRLTINEVADGSDAGATMGTVTFDSGETLEFSQIETILTDPQNEDPDAMDDFVSVDEDDSVLIAPLANDTDPDGDPLEIVDFTDPSNGTLVDNGDGTFTYTPDPDYNGPDSFTYTVSDGQGGTDTATVNITVDPVNDDPVAVDDDASTDEDTPVVIAPLANDSDVDGDPLEIDSFTQPDNGTVTDNGDGTLTYTPDPDFNGTDTFEYTVSDGNGGSDTATITVEVEPENDAPMAEDDEYDLDEDDTVTFDPTSNDSDPDGDPLEVTDITDPANGTITDNGDGTFTYTPDPDFNGTDEVTYTVDDGNGGTDTATITFNVAPVNDDPVAEDDDASTDEDTPVVIAPLANDSDVDGDPLEIDSFTQPDNGTVTDNGDGTLTYTPDPDFNGTDTFEYTVSDGNGGSDTATITVEVEPENDAPMAEDDEYDLDEDDTVTFDPTS